MPISKYQHPWGELAFKQSGDSDRAIVCLHSNSSSKEAFKHFHSSELLKKWTIVAIDLPGHGDSENAELGSKAYTISGMAMMINNLILQLPYSIDCVIGWSLGGHVALEMGAQNSSLRKIALSGTPPVGPGLDGLRDAFIPSEHMALTGKLQFEDTEADLYARNTIGKTITQHPELSQAVARADGACRVTMYEDWSKEGAGFKQADFVKTWKGQLAIFQGEDDPFIAKKYLAELPIKNLWNNKIYFIPDAGHAPMLDNPKDYCQLLQQFLLQ